jgi:porin
VRAQPAGNVTVLAGVFDDNPPGGPFDDDSQTRGAEQSGAKFNTGTGALAIAEVQYSINQPSTGETDHGGGRGGLPGVYKLGGWYDSGQFPDQRFDTTGLSLADPNSTGVAKLRRGNWSLYGGFDQMVWRPDPDGPRAVGVFARAMGAPADRNLVEFSINAGVTLKAPLPGRDDDSVGLGYGFTKISSRAVQFDQDTAAFAGAYPIRSSESFIELTYQAQIAPWLVLQPDAQYVFMPSGGIQNPLNPATRIGNEAVFGIRTNIIF